MSQNKRIPDADLSSAGDDFHILWAIKKSLDLLNFDEKGLKAVTIEGVEENASKKLDPTGEKFLGIDLTEYYGGIDFETANSVIISQLKYSTRRANESLTYSKLYNGKKSKKGSIIHRLATTFKVFLDEYGRNEVIRKTIIKLVSNRGVNTTLFNQFTQIHSFLRKNKRPLSFNVVLNKLPNLSRKPFDELRQASGLNLTEFTDFIRLLDFEDCGADSRQKLNFELIKSIAETSIKSQNQFNSLFQMIWRKMMPESDGERTITLIDVVTNFGFSSIDNLFPVSQNFEKNSKVVNREQLDDIVFAIQQNTTYLPICIHGGAGIGKSTIINQAKNRLPEYSECILFDSYGAGKYQNPEDKRHLHKNAITQIANELAKNVGTDFLLVQNESDDVYLTEFIRRIEKGVEILRNRNPLASLVFIIDAADNSVTAAQNFGEKSFIEDLFNIDIPDGCHFIATSRTYRKESLNLPDKYLDIELKPFSLDETTLFIKKSFPDITDEEILEFHKYTKGIPRVQFYSLDLREQGINEIINYLKPNGKVVEDLILDKIEQAVIRIGKEKRPLVEEFFKLLISLPRPVPIEYLSEILNVEISFLSDLSSDIWNGLILEDGLFRFRDEDFENYVKQTYQSTKEELKQIAKLLLSKSKTDEYASINLGSLLFTADYKKELVEIVLKRELLEFPKDTIRNKEVYANRTKLALKVSKDIQDSLTYFKLLFIAAEESKTDKALTRLLIDYPDLVSRFGDEVSLSRLKLKSNEKPWGGSFHLKLAGIYSRRVENKEIVLKHLRTAREWINWRRSKKDEELRDYTIETIDIVYEVEAVLRIFGIEKAIETINRWRPKEIRLSVGNYLVENIISYSKDEEINSWLKYPKFRLVSQVFIICKSFQYGIPINYDINSIAIRLANVLPRVQTEFKENFKQLIIQFCGILAYHKIDTETILGILEKIKTKPLERIPYFYNSYSDKDEEKVMSNFLNMETLILSLNEEEADLENFYPEKFNDLDKIEDYEKRNYLESDKREFTGFYKYAIPVFQLYSDILTNRINEKVCLAKFKSICSEIKNDYHFKYENRHWSNDRLLFLSGKLADVALLFKNRTKLIDVVISSFDSQTDKLRLRFEVLNKIILQRDIEKTSYQLIDQSDKIIKDSELSANEMVENYIKCLLLSSKIDDSFGQYFFDEAIKATSEIDYEAFTQILSIYYLSGTGITKPNPKLAYEYARFIEYCDVKLGYYDKKHFPYLEGLLGIGNIDTSSMFATICRWHHRNIASIGSRINYLSKRALENEYIDHITAASLLPIKTNYNYEELEQLYKLLIQKFDEVGNPETKDIFIKSEFHNLRLDKDKHFVRKIYNEVKSGKFIDKNTVSEIKNYIDFLDSLEKKNDKETNISGFNKGDFKHIIVLSAIDTSSTKELEKAIDSIIVNSANSYNHRWGIENFLSDIVDKCAPNEYTQFLNALVDVNEKLLDFHTFENIIEKAINEWDYYPEIKKWKQEKFKYILLNKLQHFDYGIALSIWSLKKFANLFSIDAKKLADVMIEILPQKIDLLSDESIYSSFEVIKHKLKPRENEELLEWILERWNAKIKPGFADGGWRDELTPPTDSNQNIAYFLRFLLGYPDKKLRWRAIHSIRRLAKLDKTEILKVLLEKQNEKDCFPFQNKEYIYYCMSAKLYLWIAIDRISLENPNILIQFKDVFYDELMNEDLPHVLIRQFIKKTCLNLNAYDDSLFTHIEVQNIKSINQTKLGYVEEKTLSREQRKYSSKSEKDWQFKFDSMDTLPYWYSRLGRCFNLSEYDVADVADKFITEKWGYTGDCLDDDYLRGQLYERDWSKMYRRHGNNPEIEDLESYFEYHAMFCSANFLLEKEPLLKTESWDSWEYWLDSEANAFDDLWLSDLRDPIPLESQYWKSEIDKFDKEWRGNIADEYFDEKIGFISTVENEWLIVCGGTTKHIGVNEESLSVQSCLVSNKGADALLRALQTTKDSHDYVIPYEEVDFDDEYRYDDKAIDENGFSLKGWLLDITSEYEGIDKHDPLFNGTSKGFIRFGNTVHSYFDIDYNVLYRKGYMENELICEYKNWNEITDDEYENRKYNSQVLTSGSIFQVSSDFLIRFLKAEQKSLIIKCVIERQLEERIYRKNYDDNRNKVKLFLIKPDGTVKTLRGRDFKIG
ncbi:AAA family ATPase [Pseudotamlana agarivorans]|uniref:AAA family ATPase n=1 Tax=Pseudotamlana agarivorans TaxID=481183 RepID=UPI000831DB9C|nr:AAA family ATPase [Tamlana agarivorans]